MQKLLTVLHKKEQIFDEKLECVHGTQMSPLMQNLYILSKPKMAFLWTAGNNSSRHGVIVTIMEPEEDIIN